MKRAIAVALGMLAWTACDGAPPPKPATLSTIQEDIFKPGCSASVCHGGPGPVDGLDLQADPFGTLVDIDSVSQPGKMRVVAGDPANSVLFQVLNGPVGRVKQMPQGVPGGLPPDDIERIKQWITDGALNN